MDIPPTPAILMDQHLEEDTIFTLLATPQPAQVPTQTLDTPTTRTSYYSFFFLCIKCAIRPITQNNTCKCEALKVGNINKIEQGENNVCIHVSAVLISVTVPQPPRKEFTMWLLHCDFAITPQ